MHKTDKYQLLTVADGQNHARLATEDDVEEGIDPGAERKASSAPALAEGARRRPSLSLSWAADSVLQQAAQCLFSDTAVYDGDSLWTIFRTPLLFGFARARSPASVLHRQRHQAAQGDEVWTAAERPGTADARRSSTRPCKAMASASKPIDYEEDDADSAAGRRPAYRAHGRHRRWENEPDYAGAPADQSRGHSAIVYDPACEFVQRFYDSDRGDIILNPLDKRCPYWGPAEELRRKAEAKAIAASLYQPTTDKKGEFFVETPQKIFAHLLTFGPSPQELVTWMANPDEIDRSVQGTEMAMMIAKGAQQQRNGVLASLGLIADSLRMLPRKEHAERSWSATEWAKERQGWIFITSQPSEREALRPLHSLWIDLLVLRLLNAPTEDQRPVWFVMDELASLQSLPQLHTAITENRKSRNPLVLGFQGKAQLEVIYGHIAEVMLSQPATKIFLKTKEPKAGEWVSDAIGKVEIERMRETHFDGSRSGKNFTLDRQVEPLVMDSEISGLGRQSRFFEVGELCRPLLVLCTAICPDAERL